MHRLPTSPCMSYRLRKPSRFTRITRRNNSNSEFGRMPRDLAMCPMCRVLVVGKEHQRREGHIEHRQPFLSFPVLLLVAAVLGFEWTLIALAASEAVKAKPAPPAAFWVEMAPHCSIKTTDRLFFL